MRSVSETAKTPSLMPSVRSVRYLRPVLSLSSFDEPSPLMTFSRQLPVIRRSALVRESLSRFQGSRCFGPCRRPPQIRRGAYPVWPQSFVARRSQGPPSVAEISMPRPRNPVHGRDIHDRPGLPAHAWQDETEHCHGTDEVD